MTWEYDSFASPISDQAAILDQLNLAGADGWELVSTQLIGSMLWAYVKRPKV